MIIAVSGKGGTGKTVVSSLLVKVLSEKDEYDILAIDADPDANFSDALGVSAEKTIGSVREGIIKDRDQRSPTQSWRSKLEYDVLGATIETDKFDILVMGRPEGQGCYCPVNHVLREIIDKTAKNYDYVIIDTEAGLEHLSRRTTQDVDFMLVVTDPSKRGITTAQRIKELSENLSINFKGIYLVANRTSPENEEKIREYAEEIGLEVLGFIPEDEKVSEFDFTGRPLMELKDSKALSSVEKIVERLAAYNEN
ncbi:MAG: AAA family ATPase [Candidatus Hydrothermarchaeaceae archaeon]